MVMVWVLSRLFRWLFVSSRLVCVCVSLVLLVSVVEIFVLVSSGVLLLLLFIVSVMWLLVCVVCSRVSLFVGDWWVD